MAELPVFVKIPNVGFTTLQTGADVYELTNTLIINNPTTFKKVFTSGESGSLIYSATIKPNSTNEAGIVRFAIKSPTENLGTLIYEQAITATTDSATTELAKYDIQFNMKLQAGYEIWVWYSVSTPGTIGVTIFGGDF